MFINKHHQCLWHWGELCPWVTDGQRQVFLQGANINRGTQILHLYITGIKMYLMLWHIAGVKACRSVPDPNAHKEMWVKADCYCNFSAAGEVFLSVAYTSCHYFSTWVVLWPEPSHESSIVTSSKTAFYLLFIHAEMHNFMTGASGGMKSRHEKIGTCEV